MTQREERIKWLACLVAAYQREHDWAEDEDPSATSECLYECRALIADLRLELRMLRTLHDQMASVAFEEHVAVPEFDIGGESGGA